MVKISFNFLSNNVAEKNFYAPQLYRQVLLRRVLAMGILTVCLSQPGGVPNPGEIETPGLHCMIA